MSPLIHKAMLEGHVTEERIFKDAFDYYEVRVAKKKLVQLYLDYLHRGVIPAVVEDYCFATINHKL